MTDNDKQVAFIEGVSKLGRTLGVSPDEALYLFGRLTRGIVEHGYKGGKGSFEELTEAALNRICSGLGGTLASVTVAKINPEGLH